MQNQKIKQKKKVIMPIQKLKENSVVRFNLENIDPDHLEWLKSQASTEGLTLDLLLDGWRNGEIGLEPAFNERGSSSTAFTEKLEQSITVTIDSTDPRVRMALKRLAHAEGLSVETWCAQAIVSQILMEESESEVDVLTGKYTEHRR
jgi:hypothetical protein